ncbi:MAG TPA: hypothetical protein VHH36_08530, partial [Candidatus Thermoplasmatota archaeon]|nr:hypothetical protein [Candidatus Thermoplasmatota archaeon]
VFDAHVPEVGYAATRAGVMRTDDAGATWRALPFPAGDPPATLALHPHLKDVLYVAARSTAIHKTVDGGETWTRIRAP